jgi:hypothetical protein
MHGFHNAGTARLQLQHKGDDNHTYTDLANILPCAGILGLPIISWLLDKKVTTSKAPPLSSVNMSGCVVTMCSVRHRSQQ